ncbi:MAG: hypothetical protein DI551_08005 [Micavibrio aeruginosavorus]|uniref:Uncharacterized protein n=1 Tax=Micavibrio aeruginosavorus TaxID=349221 RepID=A0A2W5MVJ6_9BACT|nr:MAG: hypothetical protein DI551_08005 [Micavibrio aeruginosavorus]
MPTIDTDTAEGKAELQKLIDAETKGLKDKNAELHGKLKKKDEEVASINERLTSLEAEKQEAEEKIANKKGDIEAVRAQEKEKYNKEIKKKDDEIAGLKDQINTHVVDGGLSAALSKAGVLPEMTEAAFDHLKARNKIEVVDGKAVIGGKTLDEFMPEWAKESGKIFVAAPGNGGGGSKGPSGQGKAEPKTLTRAEFDGLQADEQAKHFKDGGKLID